MLLIPCPWCGPRDEPEFRYGGQAHLTRPEPFNEVSGAAWADYLFTRSNPKGVHRERWLHAGGCGRWFNVLRDTRTHAIEGVYLMGEAPPDPLSEGSAA